MANADFDDLPWEEIQKISQDGLFEQVFKKIPKSLFRFAVQEENKTILTESALKSLRKKDPNATYGQATLLADIMQTYARKVLEG